MWDFLEHITLEPYPHLTGESIYTRRGKKLRDHGYFVFYDGKKIGWVEGRHYHAHTRYQGTRIRRDLGYPKGWRAYDLRGKKLNYWYDTRKQAVRRLVEVVIDDSS